MIVKKLVFLYIFCCSVVLLFAQQDPVLLRVNGEVIIRSEFEKAYKNHLASDSVKKGVKEYLNEFIDDRLKIIEAKTLGLNLEPGFQLKMKEYSGMLQGSSLIENNMRDVLFREGVLSDRYTAERFLIMQIFKYIPQNCSSTELEKTTQMMTQLHTRLVADPQADFASYIEEYSDDKRTLEISRMEVGLEFEQSVFSMHKGEISAPFLTPQGIHIVKVLDKKDALSDSELSGMSQLRVRQRYKNGGHGTFLQGLKEVYNYTPNVSAINELLTSGKTDRGLFTLNGKAYTSSDFYYFASSNPKAIRRQFDDFVTKSLIDCEVERIGKESPTYSQSVEEYEDAFLLSEITRRQVIDKARTDQAGLLAYFSVHKKKYRWASPRFRGVVLHTRDKKIIPEAKKLVKKIPVDEWGSLIMEYFNLGAVQQVQVEQGLFGEGDNPYVDDLVFKKGNVESLQSYPFTAVIGKKVKGPENYKEVLNTLVPDYEKFLKKRWITHLHDTYRVEINEEVLKTVNNH